MPQHMLHCGIKVKKVKNLKKNTLKICKNIKMVKSFIATTIKKDKWKTVKGSVLRLALSTLKLQGAGKEVTTLTLALIES
jgi:hypothetical protein